MKTFALAVLAAMPLAVVAAPPVADPVRLDTLLVTASPIDAPASETLRSVQVIERADIARSTARTLADLLAGQPGLSLTRRGAPGVQADLGIRGASFEQTLVLLDGLPIQNPQAGHHNLDVPVPLAHIERIEIVKGPGAIQYGASATGGVVNIITRRSAQPERRVRLTVGSHNSREVEAMLALGGPRAHTVSASTLDTDGDDHAGPTDARLRQLLYTGVNNGERTRLGWGVGALEKDFGAWAFYSAEYPDAREQTRSQRAWISLEKTLGAWDLGARTFHDRHQDWFLTRIAGRDYINEHRTRITGAQADLRRQDNTGTTALGLDLRHEQLASNALADHRRDRSALWLLRQQALGERTRLEASLNVARYQGDRERWLPALALSHEFSSTWRGFAAGARSARLPSYTELYLATAANRGSADLRPETADYAELGTEARLGAQRLQASLYRRQVRQWIDWTRTPDEVTWVAANIDGYRGRGLDVHWHWQPDSRWLDSLALGFDRLQVALDEPGHEVKYAPQVPTRTWTGEARLHLGARTGFDLDLRRPHYAGQGGTTLAALRFTWQGQRLNGFVAVENLLDRDIIETGFAPIPGRWLSLGLEAQWP